MTEPRFPNRDWTVLLVGGTSGAGKTTAARSLARRFGVGLAQADAFRLAIERVTTPEQQPALHFFKTPEARALDPEAACERWIEAGRVTSYALEIVIAFHLATHAPIILEGDTLHPGLLRKRYLPGARPGNNVRGIFLVEPDEERILASCRHRGRGFQELTPDEQEREARRHWLYGRWIEAEAARVGAPVLHPAAPGEVAAQVAAALGLA